MSSGGTTGLYRNSVLNLLRNYQITSEVAALFLLFMFCFCILNPPFFYNPNLQQACWNTNELSTDKGQNVVDSVIK